MSIASEITRLQGVKSDILSAIADKGVTVPVGSALADCPSLIGDISGGGNTEEILGRNRGIVKIGSLIWTSENIDYIPNNTQFGSIESNENAVVSLYGFNSNNYNNRGLWYNKLAMEKIQALLTNGWRVPLYSDFVNLYNAVNGDLTKLSMPKYWNYGDNETGFNGIPGGHFYNGNWEFINTQFYLIGQENEGNGIAELVCDPEWFYYANSYNFASMRFLRLCKDA